MKSVVLRFMGLPALKSQAMELLRQQLPGIILTPKTSNLLEAQVDDALVSRLMKSKDWEVTLPSYAEIRAPAFDYSRFRDELGS